MKSNYTNLANFLFSPCRMKRAPARILDNFVIRGGSLPPLHPKSPESPILYSLRDSIGNLCLRLRNHSIARERKRVFRRFTFTEEDIFRSKLTPSNASLCDRFVSDWRFYPTPHTKLLTARHLARRISQRT